MKTLRFTAPDLVDAVASASWVRRLRAAGHALLGPLVLFAVWWVAAEADLVSARLLPDPVTTLASLWQSTIAGDMLQDFAYTLYRTGYAFALATLFGVPLGVLLGANDRVYRSVEFLVDFFRSTPATAMFPLFLLIFGLGDFARISVAAFAAWLVIVFNTAYGVMNARQTRIDAARVMGASGPQVLKDVMFYESLTPTFVGLRMGVSIALVVIIVAEMFIGSNEGMGHRIIDAQQIYDLADMYASILVTGVLGYGFNLAFLGLEKWLIHWSGH